MRQVKENLGGRKGKGCTFSSVCDASQVAADTAQTMCFIFAKLHLQYIHVASEAS